MKIIVDLTGVKDEKLNAFSEPLIEATRARIREAVGDDSAEVIVLPNTSDWLNRLPHQGSHRIDMEVVRPNSEEYILRMKIDGQPQPIPYKMGLNANSDAGEFYKLIATTIDKYSSEGHVVFYVDKVSR